MQSLAASTTGKLGYSVLELMIGEKLLTGGAKKAGVAAGNSAANIAGDLILDTALDTVPNAAADAADGLEGREIASNAVKSVGKNLGYNMLAEGAVALPNVVGKIKSRWPVAAGDALEDAARYLDDMGDSARVLDDVEGASKYADDVIEGGLDSKIRPSNTYDTSYVGK